MDNWFSDHKGKSWNDIIPELSSGIRLEHQTNELRYDSKFIEICKKIDLTPKYQY